MPLNREQRRLRDKKMNKNIPDMDRLVELFKALSAESGKYDIRNGERVILNVENIVSRSDYAKKQDAYKDFIHANSGRIFTARVYRYHRGFPVLFEFEEDNTWLFWYGDLLRADDHASETEESK